MKYIRRHIFSLLTLMLIAVLSLMPAQEFPQTDIQFADKWAHWVMYGFLTLVMGIDYVLRDEYLSTKPSASSAQRQRYKNKGAAIWQLLVIAIIASVYGGLMELGQAYLTTSRHGDWLDVLANSFGALCALVLLIIYHLFTGKRS
jgi:VanZ family protein